MARLFHDGCDFAFHDAREVVWAAPRRAARTRSSASLTRRRRRHPDGEVGRKTQTKAARKRRASQPLFIVVAAVAAAVTDSPSVVSAWLCRRSQDIEKNTDWPIFSFSVRLEDRRSERARARTHHACERRNGRHESVESVQDTDDDDDKTDADHRVISSTADYDTGSRTILW